MQNECKGKNVVCLDFKLKFRQNFLEYEEMQYDSKSSELMYML